MFKILHTSDWHLGHKLYGISRNEEHQAFINQLFHIIQDEQPDVLLVAGDIYDSTLPPNEAKELYTDTMIRLHREFPALNIILTAGNHDNKTVLNIEGRILRELNINLIGDINMNEDEQWDLQHFIIPIEKKGFVVAVPHFARFPQVEKDCPTEERPQRFFSHLFNLVEAQNTNHLPVVLSVHDWVRGADAKSHEWAQTYATLAAQNTANNRHDTIGGLEGLSQSVFGDRYQYLALGHIHRPQTLKGTTPTARYSGTPIACSFDESYPHSVSIVTFNDENPLSPEIKEVNIQNPIPLLTIPPEPASFQEALDTIRNMDNNEKGNVRLNILDSNAIPANYNEMIQSAFNGKKLRYCTFVMKEDSSKKNSTDGTPQHITYTPETLPNPFDLALQYYKSKKNEDMPANIVALLTEAFNEYLNSAQDNH